MGPPPHVAEQLSCHKKLRTLLGIKLDRRRRCRGNSHASWVACAGLLEHGFRHRINIAVEKLDRAVRHSWQYTERCDLDKQLEKVTDALRELSNELVCSVHSSADLGYVQCALRERLMASKLLPTPEDYDSVERTEESGDEFTSDDDDNFPPGTVGSPENPVVGSPRALNDMGGHENAALPPETPPNRPRLMRSSAMVMGTIENDDVFDPEPLNGHQYISPRASLASMPPCIPFSPESTATPEPQQDLFDFDPHTSVSRHQTPLSDYSDFEPSIEDSPSIRPKRVPERTLREQSVSGAQRQIPKISICDGRGEGVEGAIQKGMGDSASGQASNPSTRDNGPTSSGTLEITPSSQEDLLSPERFPKDARQQHGRRFSTGQLDASRDLGVHQNSFPASEPQRKRSTSDLSIAVDDRAIALSYDPSGISARSPDNHSSKDETKNKSTKENTRGRDHQLAMVFESHGTKKDRTARPVQALVDLIRDKLVPESARPGYVYCWSDASAPGYLKIGHTRAEVLEPPPPAAGSDGGDWAPPKVWDRIREYNAACGRRVDDAAGGGGWKLEHFAAMPCAAWRMESLVHRTLHRRHRTVTRCFGGYRCSAPKKGHQEWFEVGVAEAIAVIEGWREFSLCMPYGDTGLLEGFWKVWAIAETKELIKQSLMRREGQKQDAERWLHDDLRAAVIRARREENDRREQETLKASQEFRQRHNFGRIQDETLFCSPKRVNTLR